MNYMFMYMLDWMFWVLVLFLLLAFVRVIRGPTIWDRLLGMNVIATKIITIIIIYAAMHDTSFLLDFAIIYTLSGFIGTIYIALFFADRREKGTAKIKADAGFTAAKDKKGEEDDGCA